MPVVNILAGVLLLFLGRRLFWLFVAVVGFIVGMNLALQYLGPESTWVAIVVGLVAGLIGAVLAVLFQRVAVALAGFMAGSYLATWLLTTLGVDLGGFEGLVSIIGGIIGAVLVFVLFDWALIVLSSLVGASLIAPAVTPDGTTQTLIFIILAIIGIVVQAGLMRRYPGSVSRPAYRRRRRRA
jgi:MFS family permease